MSSLQLSLTMDPNPRDHLRQAIDSQINSLKESVQESVRALSQRRNELAPISSLPTEIITDIIFLASAERGVVLTWLNVAHICRQWREIVFNQPLFWSHIDFTKITSAGAAEMLARAKGAPLHLEAMVGCSLVGCGLGHAQYSVFDKEFQAHVSHIRHLDITGILGNSCPFLWTALQHTLVGSPAPILEYLSLFVLDRDSRALFLPNNVFKGSTPRLSFLKLYKIDISWKSSLLRGLRYLRIYELNDDHRLSVTDWLDALDNMPQLKELALTDASPLADGFTFPSHIKRTAALPILTRLELYSTARACALALAHLVLPALTSLILKARSSDDRGHDALILLPYVTQHAHGPQDAKPLQSVLFRSDEACTCIVARSTGMPEIYDVAHCQPWLWPPEPRRTERVVLTITCEKSHSWYTSTYVRVLDAAIEALPLNDIVTLAAESDARLDEQVWLRHAPRWSLLEHVQLAHRAARGLREMFLLEDNCERESPLLPSLRQLDLIGESSLTKRRTLRLCDAFKKRMEQGVPLRVFGWSADIWTFDAVWLLRRIVADVRGPGPEEYTWQREEPLGWVPETSHFVDGYGDSDEEREGRADPDKVEVEEDDDGKEEEEEDEG